MLTLKKCGGVLLAIAALSGLAACGSDDEEGATAAAPAATEASTGEATKLSLDGKTIAYVQTAPLPYYEYTAQGITQAVESLGGEAKVLQSNFDPQAERANVQNAITQRVDGVILEPISAATTKSSLRLLDAAGIPAVVLYGYDKSLEDQAAGFQQTLPEDTGAAAGEQLKQLVPEGDVAIVTGTRGRGEAEGFSRGFRQAFGDDARVVEEVDGNYERQTAFKVAQDVITKHPDLKGVFVHNEDMTAGVIKALGAKVDDVAIVTQNGSPEGLELVKEGKIKATVGWSPAAEGAMAVRGLAQALAGSGPADKLCLTPFAVNTPDEPAASVPWEPTPEIISAALETPCAEA